MFCEKCGTKNDSSSKFCEKCGAELIKEVKTENKAPKEKNEVKAKPTLSKKQKLIGGIVGVIVVILVALYFVAAKMTSLDTMGDKVFKELASKNTISNKYLSEPLDSDAYFVSLEEVMKNKIEDEDIKFDEDDYTVKSSNRKITVTYREDDDKYKIVFRVKKDGKSLVLFDKYIIDEITVMKDRKNISLYNPENMEKMTVSTLKGSKLTVNDKDVPKSYLNSKKSDKETDVYVIKGVTKGEVNVKFSFGKLAFEKNVYVYSDSDNEFDLTDYISSYYLVDDGKEYTKVFKNYITTYYEYANDESKTVEDFNKKYKVTDDIKDDFATSKEYSTKLESFKIKDVELRSLYYYSSDDELVVTYKVDYTYKMVDSESERSNYDTVRVTYNLKDAELPVKLSYMPY